MEEEKEGYYEIKFTKFAKQYFEELLSYFYDLYSTERAENVANALVEKAFSLSQFPLRGRIEGNLIDHSLEYRYILFQRTKRADIKNLYRVDEFSKTVYLIDFFPTELDRESISDRV